MKYKIGVMGNIYKIGKIYIVIIAYSTVRTHKIVTIHKFAGSLREQRRNEANVNFLALPNAVICLGKIVAAVIFDTFVTTTVCIQAPRATEKCSKCGSSAVSDGSVPPEKSLYSLHPIKCAVFCY